MARFYEIRIDTIYLTDDGTAGGDGCRLEVANWEDLLTTVTGNVRLNADGSPDFQLYAWTAGKQFEVRVLTWINQEQWEALRDLLNDSLENAVSWTVTGTGETGDFTVTARAFVEKPFSAGRFRNGKVFEPVFRFITV